VDDPITELVARRYLSEIKQQNISTVILGCTHYPVIKSDLIKVLGEDVKLVESGDVLAEELKALYQDHILLPDEGVRQIRVCITDLTDHFERLAHQLMAPEKISDLERIVL
jgi:glutamate racemase